MQINSFPLLRTTSDKGVPGQSNPFNVPGCLSPLLSFPALPAVWAVGGGEGAVDWLHRRWERRCIVMRSWVRREKEGGVCVRVQLCVKGLELGGGITSSSVSVATSWGWPWARGGIHRQSKLKWMLKIIPIPSSRVFFLFFTLRNWDLGYQWGVSRGQGLKYRSPGCQNGVPPPIPSVMLRGAWINRHGFPYFIIWMWMFGCVSGLS